MARETRRPPSVLLCGTVLTAALLEGCRAGPPPEDFPDPLPARSDPGALEEPRHWTEAVDGAIFGSNEETVRSRRRKSPGEAPRDPSVESDPNVTTGSVAGAPEAPAVTRVNGVAGSGATSSPETPDVPEAKEAAALTLRAARAIQEDRLEEAAALLERAIEAAPRHERWIPRRALGDVYLALRRSRDAVRLYRDVLGSPGALRLAELHGNLAVAHLRLGELDLSRAAAETSLEIHPGSPEVLKTLGLVDILDGSPESGRERLYAALRSGKEVPEAEVALAELEEASGELESALRRYRRLAVSFESHRLRDHHRRWRDLFFPTALGTAGELQGRIERLEAVLRE